MRSMEWPGQLPFIDGGDNFYRWVISNTTVSGGWTASTTPMVTMSTLVGEYWDSISSHAYTPAVTSKQSQLSLTSIDNGPVFQPLVQVQCSAHSSNHTQHALGFPNSRLKTGDTNTYTNVTWPVPSNYTDANLLDYNATGNLYAARLPLNSLENPPSALWVFVVTDEENTRTVIPCSVLAHWVPSELSVYPRTDRNIHDTFSDPIEIVSSVELSQSDQLMISDGWWEMLTVNDTLVLNKILTAIGMVGSDGLRWYDAHGAQGLAYHFSNIIGMFLTDAIARYAPITESVIQYDAHNGTEPYYWPIADPNVSGGAAKAGWLKFVDTNPGKWKEATFVVLRYGYSWSFSGVLSKVAGVALLIHSLLALAHVGIMFHGRWTSSAWDSIGNSAYING